MHEIVDQSVADFCEQWQGNAHQQSWNAQKGKHEEEWREIAAACSMPAKKLKQRYAQEPEKADQEFDRKV